MLRFPLRAAVAALGFCLAGSSVVAVADTVKSDAAAQNKPMNANLKAALSRLVLAKPIGHFVSRRRIPPLATALTLTVAPNSARAPKIGSNVQSALAGIKTCEALDPSIPPAIRHLKGKIASGGYIVIDGDCFGTTGVVEFVGDFSGGRLALQNQAWSPSSITAAIPSVAGVYDQRIRIRVVRGNIISNEVTAEFVPEMEERAAPAAMVMSSHCDFDDYDCKDGAAKHYAQSGGALGRPGSNGQPSLHSGEDRWMVRPPTGWSASYVDGTLYAGVASVGDFDSSPGVAFFIPTHWEDNLSSYATSAFNTLWGLGPSERFYTSAYSLTVHLIGPRGTWR
ncbi:MAG: hypothetical protein ABR591_00080 [Candidatus Velthaea sp.]